MPANRPQRPASRPQIVPIQASTASSQQIAFDQLERLAAKLPVPRATITVDLIVGTNRIVHGLGRKSRGATVSPSVADATFAWSHAPDGDLVAVITVVGVAQPGASVEIY